MGFIRNAMKGLGDVGRAMVTPKSKKPAGGRRRGVNRGRGLLSVRKSEKRRMRK